MENAASRFGQHLAHTEKKYRDRALKKLTVYLSKKTEWTELEWDKLWKALFYCMWMSDKRPVQEELSLNLAALVHEIPEPHTALEFVHSFLRTMHREWHGLDGLRLDKFYSLVRKFVRETVALLRVHHWDDTLVQKFLAALANEIVTQLPNGLRMHVADVYLAEIHNAAANEITTAAFLTLLEPFLTLLSCEYDKTVFKRVRDVVFETMLVKYKFGPQAAKNEHEVETDREEEEEEEEEKVFPHVDLVQIQHRLFTIASADATIECNRSGLYTLYKKFFLRTHVDSFQAVLENMVERTTEPVKMASPVTEHVQEDVVQDEIQSTTKNKSIKSKKRATKQASGVQKESAVKEEKKHEPNVPAQKDAKHDENDQADDVRMSRTRRTKTTKERAAGNLPSEEEHATVEKETTGTKTVSVMQEQIKKDRDKIETRAPIVTKSRQRFRRCDSCGGFGKGLVPRDKQVCGHCEQTSRTTRAKKASSASNKRKAPPTHAQSAREEPAPVAKRVTFGKSKALRHVVSVKRLKACSKRESVPRQELKGVLKGATPLPTPGRKSAADFF
ncbi:hypothetical protein PsorP6_009762 [Peronosclerospora sorghi]|uniref:Uncharacterized protein n=1 Tax=Peronosclerospora sorghi TaxID=230839 RepID=A0ACC0VYZ9_9STRA|nr:hypothetical protein PsorP6_009762 [Peronosclerospora sorghi]